MIDISKLRRNGEIQALTDAARSLLWDAARACECASRENFKTFELEIAKARSALDGSAQLIAQRRSLEKKNRSR